MANNFTQSASWSHKVETIMVLSGALSLAIAWCLQYFPNSMSLVERLSYKVEDPSWAYPGYESIPIIGQHYFGDFQYFISFSAATNPWDGEMTNTPFLLNNIIYLILGNLPIFISWVLFVCLSLITLFFGARALVIAAGPKFDNWNFIRRFLIFVLLTAPVLMDFDRGNSHSIAVGAAAIFVGNEMQGNKSRWNIVWLFLAISIRPYYAILLFILIHKKKYKLTTVSLSIFLTINLIYIQLVSGNVFVVARNYLATMLGFAGSSEFGMGQIAHSGSLAGAAHRLVEYFFGFQISFQWLKDNILLLEAASLLYIISVLFLWTREKIARSLRVFFLFSVVGVAQPGAMGYTWIWLGLCALAIIYETEKDSFFTNTREQFSRISQIWLAVIFVVGLVPTWVILPSLSGSNRQVANFLVLTPLLVGYLLYIIYKEVAPHGRRDGNVVLRD